MSRERLCTLPQPSPLFYSVSGLTSFTMSRTLFGFCCPPPTSSPSPHHPPNPPSFFFSPPLTGFCFPAGVGHPFSFRGRPVFHFRIKSIDVGQIDFHLRAIDSLVPSPKCFSPSARTFCAYPPPPPPTSGNTRFPFFTAI